MLILLLWGIIFVIYFIFLSWFDIKQMILPNYLTISLACFGVIAGFNHLFCSVSQCLWGMLFGYLSLYVLSSCCLMITGKIGMGMGDVKLYAALGGWFGVSSLAKILFLSSWLACGFVLLFYILRRSVIYKVPFGPFLLLSGLIELYKFLI